MTAKIPKPAICWGLFRMMGVPHLVEDNEYLMHSVYTAMKVTSFSQLPNGTRMAHGQRLEDGRSMHRNVSGMLFFQTKEAMDESLEAAQRVEPSLRSLVRNKVTQLEKAKRDYRVKVDNILGKRAIQPLELDRLQD